MIFLHAPKEPTTRTPTTLKCKCGRHLVRVSNGTTDMVECVHCRASWTASSFGLEANRPAYTVAGRAKT